MKEPFRLPITNVPLTVLDAISLTGGLGPQANWRDVIFLSNGKRRTLSSYDMFNEGALRQHLLLRDGDVLHVPDLDNQKIFVMRKWASPPTSSTLPPRRWAAGTV